MSREDLEHEDGGGLGREMEFQALTRDPMFENSLLETKTTVISKENGNVTSQGSAMNRPKISVVVCSHNGGSRIAGTLEALSRQSVLIKPGHSGFETIVVDDGSSDDTSEVAGRYANQKGVHVLRLHPNVGLSAARNAGWQASLGEIIAFCDDDCIPPDTWIEQLETLWGGRDASVAGIGGLVQAAEEHLAGRYADMAAVLQPIEHVRSGIVSKLRRYWRGPIEYFRSCSVDSLVGANMSFRRKAIEEVKGFNPDIRFGGDETYLCRELRTKYGEDSLIVEPGLVMKHAYHPSLRDAFRRGRAYGRGARREWRTHGGIPSIPPGILGLIGGGKIVTAWGWWFGGVVWVVVGGLVWLAVAPHIIAPWAWRRASGGLRWWGAHLHLLVETATLQGFLKEPRKKA